MNKLEDFKVGMTVRVKTRQEILALNTAGGHGSCKKFGISWNDEMMTKFCGKSFTVTQIGDKRVTLDTKKMDPDYSWVWSPCWLIIPPKISLPEDLFKL